MVRQDAEQRTVALAYDTAHRVQSLINENGERFEFIYDAADRVIEERRVDGTRVTIDYDANGWPIVVTHHPGIGDDLNALASDTATATEHGQPHDRALRTELIRDAVGRLIEKRTASHHYRYRYDKLDQLVEATKLRVVQAADTEAGSPADLQPLHTTRFAYDVLGNLIAETAVDEITGETHALEHAHDPLGNRTRTELPLLPGQPDARQALNYLYYGSGHLHQVNLSQQTVSPQTGDAPAIHQLISDIERDVLHREVARSQGLLATRFALDPVGRRTGAWSRSASVVQTPFNPLNSQDGGWRRAIDSAGTAQASALNGLMKEYRYDPVGELRQSRHSLKGATGHSYDATGRIEESVRVPVAGSAGPSPAPGAANHERFAYDPAGNLLDASSTAAIARSTAHAQRGYVRDNLVRVFEDKRYFYDGHGRLIKKLSGKYTAQRFEWDDESQLTQVTTIRRPGTEHQTSQTTRFEYDAIGRRIAKHDAFGVTRFIWEGMRLLQERRGRQVVSYVYEPDSYVPLARLDATGTSTTLGGMGTTADQVAAENLQSQSASSTHLTAAIGDQNRIDPANDESGRDWQALQEGIPAQPLKVANGDHRICDVFYFHTDQVGLPEELTNNQGKVCWQASYKTWGSTVAEEWEVRSTSGQAINALDEGPKPSTQQNLRFQGQYLDSDTGLHYNTFRFYDPDIGRFISSDPIGLNGGINLGSYAPNPVAWIDPWGWSCGSNAVILRKNMAREGRIVQPTEAAGHVVASGGSQGRWAPAAKARDLLGKYGIGVNDAANGIRVGHPNPHGKMHTGAYHQKVLNRLEGVESRMKAQGYGRNSIRSALRRELRKLGKEPL